jgi:hypothetical protein
VIQSFTPFKIEGPFSPLAIALELMADAELVHRATLVLASEAWWKPIVGYIVTNCAKFTGHNFTNEEHDCFLGFRKLFTELFDCFVCKKIGVKSSVLETAFSNACTQQENPEALEVMQMLRNYSDFVFFRQEMVNMSQKVQDATADRLLEFRRTGGTDDDTGGLATFLEESEQILLDSETRRKITEFCADVRLDEAEAQAFPETALKPTARAAPGPPPRPTSVPIVLRSPRAAILKPMATKH